MNYKFPHGGNINIINNPVLSSLIITSINPCFTGFSYAIAEKFPLLIKIKLFYKNRNKIILNIVFTSLNSYFYSNIHS